MEVAIQNHDGKPDEILDVLGFYWEFDENGSILEGMRSAIASVAEFWLDGHGDDDVVVPIGPRLKRQQFLEKHRWTPAQSDFDLVEADLWPGEGGRRPEVVRGKPKEPKLTWEAQHVLNEFSKPLLDLSFGIDRLKEPSLAGLAFEARRKAEDPDIGPVLLGVAEIAEKQLRLLRRRRSRKGTWYGLVEIGRRTHDNIWEIVASYHERCDGKHRAIAAARRLLAEHAQEFSDDVTVEAFVETDLEWEEADRVSTESPSPETTT